MHRDPRSTRRAAFEPSRPVASQPAVDGLDLRVAGIGLRLQPTAPFDLGALGARLKSFVQPARRTTPSDEPRATPDLRIDLTPPSPHPGPPCAADIPPRFESGRLILQHPRLDAELDAQAGRGSARLASSRPWADLEYLLRLACMLAAFERGGLVLHAAAIVDGPGARLFYGPSGSGKTSLARRAGSRRVLNDDLVLLLPDAAGRWMAHATPFTGADRAIEPRPGQAPVLGLYPLDRARRPRLEDLRRSELIAGLVASTPVVSLDPGRLPRLLERLDSLIDGRPRARLFTDLDRGPWQLFAHTETDR